MTHETDFRADVERACDDARLSVTAIGSILIDEGHKWLALASADTLPKGQDAKQGLAGTEGSAVTNEVRQTPKA